MAAPPWVSIGWDANAAEDMVAGYRVYWGSQGSRVYGQNVEVPGAPAEPRHRIEDLTPGATYWIAVTAYNAYGMESEFSNELTVTIPASPPQIPGGARQLLQINLQSSNDLREWFHVASYQHVISDPREFWRVEFAR